MTKIELESYVLNFKGLGKEGLELVKSTIAKGQWKQLCKNERFKQLLKDFEVEE